MPNTRLTVKNVAREIKARLGGLHVDVEITAGDFITSLRAALDKLNRNKPMRGWAKLDINRTTKKYGPLDTLHPGFQGVIHFDTVRERNYDTPLDPFDPYLVIEGPTKVGDLTYGDYFQQLAYLEDAKRLSGAETEWHGQWEWDSVTEANHYYLYVDKDTTVTVNASYLYVFHVQPTDDARIGLPRIDDSDVDLVLDYTEARCKQILGRVLRKFGGIPTPDGGTDTTDGETLVTEAREDMQRLEEEFKRRRRPLEPITE